jgi:hypothetical protein
VKTRWSQDLRSALAVEKTHAQWLYPQAKKTSIRESSSEKEKKIKGIQAVHQAFPAISWALLQMASSLWFLCSLT